MPTIKERITITPDSEKDVKQIKILANLTKVTHSKLGARIISEWLKTKTKEMKNKKKSGRFWKSSVLAEMGMQKSPKIYQKTLNIEGKV